MHDILTGFFVPNDVDKAQGIKGQFGSTINVINGGRECGLSATNLTDQTRIANTTWYNLKTTAMADDYQEEYFYGLLDAEGRLLLEALRTAQ